jgi:hypothetical protein
MLRQIKGAVLRECRFHVLFFLLFGNRPQL